jgi:hypothetical protein
MSETFEWNQNTLINRSPSYSNKTPKVSSSRRTNIRMMQVWLLLFLLMTLSIGAALLAEVKHEVKSSTMLWMLLESLVRNHISLFKNIKLCVKKWGISCSNSNPCKSIFLTTELYLQNDLVWIVWPLINTKMV